MKKIQEGHDNCNIENTSTNEISDSPIDDSDVDPLYISDSHVQCCEVSDCTKDVFSLRHISSRFLCYSHLVNMGVCENEHKAQPTTFLRRKENKPTNPEKVTVNYPP